MCAERQITQSYMLLENEAEYLLEYYMFSELTQNGDILYGVKIIQHSGGCVTLDSAIISSNEEYTLQTIYRFAKNYVFPDSLYELIEHAKQRIRFSSKYVNMYIIHLLRGYILKYQRFRI